MDKLGTEEVNHRRPGRTYGFEVQDDLASGEKTLKKEGKLKNFIKQTTVHLEVVGLQGGSSLLDGKDEDWGTFDEADLMTREVLEPPPSIPYLQTTARRKDGMDSELVVESNNTCYSSNDRFRAASL
ncbi:hypothetical protein PAXRUDRAFT_29196 [Paxillus rubicundulus Ve08.2h10]|uniref:Uncharacterized protein n=1 Tax=Paxillus rubicundulus Ve08.2h10 TaxID=930991 RepID=A0A0D0D2F8_9AGAM|nr:hypothetical protein PAXRUDRAFT_29196 [Paxillus rubicundulus Ve08.2h10]